MSKRVWGAVIVPIGHADVFGGMWDVDELFWTVSDAVRGIERHAAKMGLLPVEWEQADEKLLIGRTHAPSDPSKAYALLVRSVRLPQGAPPT
jgi:hypothetical protein